MFVEHVSVENHVWATGCKDAFVKLLLSIACVILEWNILVRKKPIYERNWIAYCALFF